MYMYHLPTHVHVHGHVHMCMSMYLLLSSIFSMAASSGGGGDGGGDGGAVVTSSLAFTIRAVPNLQISCEATTGARVEFALKGPESMVSLIRLYAGEVALVSGLASPISPVTIFGREAAALGIPSEATAFAFSYPLLMSQEATSALIDAAIRAESWRVMGSTALLKPPAWLDFCLTGGFIYWDQHMRIVRINALGVPYGIGEGLMAGAERWELSLDGPHAAPAAVGETLEASGRMEPVTVEALEKAGFATFGWVNPGEQQAHGLTIQAVVSNEQRRPHHDGSFLGRAPSVDPRKLRTCGGAFLYSSPDAFYFYELVPHAGDAPSFEAASRSRAAVALDTGLRRSVAQLREMIRAAHERATALLKVRRDVSDHGQFCRNPSVLQRWWRGSFSARVARLAPLATGRGAYPQPGRGGDTYRRRSGSKACAAAAVGAPCAVVDTCNCLHTVRPHSPHHRLRRV